MRQSLQEYCDSRDTTLRVDREAGILRGVKILGVVSRNGRRYQVDALRKAAALYENAKVNVNHPKGSPLSPRDYQDRIGVVRNVAVRDGEGLFADFHFNPKHALAEQLAWDARHAPENVGFSHNVEALTSRDGEHVIVEEILKVQGVDLVADPATTRGLFEAVSSPADADGEREINTGRAIHLSEANIEQLSEQRPDLVAEVCSPIEAKLAQLRAELEGLRAEEFARKRRIRVRQLLAEFHLPDPETAGQSAESIISDTFLEAVTAAPSEEAARELVAERARLLEAARRGHWPLAAGRPRSKDQYQVDVTFSGDVTAESFVRAIT